MEQYKKIVRRVGLGLIMVWLIDIAYMLYCILRDESYSSSLNVFAVIAGIFLIRGNLAAVRVVTWFSAFFLAGFLGVLLVLFPTMQPLDLWVTEFRVNTRENLLSFLLAVSVIVFFAWVYRQMRSPAVIAARAEVGQVTAPPKLAFLIGAILVVALAVIAHLTASGDNASKALELAKQKSGPGFRYHVKDIHWAGQHGSATVTAYNEKAIDSVEVKW